MFPEGKKQKSIAAELDNAGPALRTGRVFNYFGHALAQTGLRVHSVMTPGLTGEWGGWGVGGEGGVG